MKVENLEDIYELSSIQQGMLFHSLIDPESGDYFEQVSFRLRGPLHAAAFQRACQEIVNRHPVLRTSFHWEELEKPLQVVQADAELPLLLEDWRALAKEAQETRWKQLLQDDQKRGFDFGEAPLMRLTLVQTGDLEHLLLWSHHHILLDGWSMGLLFQEVLACYDAYVAGREVSLPERPSFGEYVSWLQEQDLAEAERYWREALKGFSAPTPLQVDQLTPAGAWAARPSGKRTHSFALSEEITKAAQSFAREHRLTLNTLMQGAWALLLNRYSGEDDVVFGVTASGRGGGLDGVEEMIGLFINTLPLRVQLPENGSALTWLQALQQRQAELQKFEHTPLSNVQEWSDVPRGTELFESLVVFENYPLDEMLAQQQRELGIDVLDVVTQTNYPLTVIVIPGTQLTVDLHYDADRFTEDTMARMAAHLQNLVLGLVERSHLSCADLPMLTEQERQQVLVDWNDTQVEYPQNICLHQLFEAQAERTPDAVAVEFEGASLTYRELNARANRLARRLQTLGAGPDVLIGVCMERSLEMVISLYGILKAGAAYVPIDPTYPPERLAYVLEDSQVPVLLTQPHLADLVMEQAATAQVLVLDADMDGLAVENAENLTAPVTATHLAYMIYTSGSTGKPKGAMNTHRAIVNRLLWMQDEYNLTEKDAVLQKTPYSFDVSVWEFFWPLFTGARLVVARPEGHKDSGYLVDLIAEKGITTLHFVPSMLQVFVEERGLEQLAGLRQVMCSGEALPYALQERFFTRLPHAELHNLYGPTEAAVDVTYWACRRNDGRTTVPIGRPVANTQIYLLDKHLQPVPVGVPGELHIGGVQLARGYHNREDLTAEKFIPNPFSTDPEARLYKTGDLARYLPDGTIEYLGRLDFQVKIRGLRIELGEIEAVLDQHETVAQSVVTAQEDGTGHKRLVAYATAAQGAELSEEALRAHLLQQLPDYMVPSVFLFLDTLPLSANGKVDRRALPQPDQPASQAEYAAPRNETEQALADVWAEVLGVERVGIDDNYFQLGGDSIRSIQIVSQSLLHDLKLSLQDVFRHPTIRRLAAAIQEGGAGEASLRALEPFALLTDADRERLPEDAADAYPLAKLQAGMLFHSRINPESSVYHNVITAHLRAPFDEGAFAEAVRWAVERHPTLRTSFDLSHYSQPLQIVHRTVPTPLQVEDLRHLPQDEQEHLLQAWYEREIEQHFDWTVAPLVRFHVHRRSEDTFQFTFTEHHAVSDGWSIATLFTEFFQVYLALANGEPNPMQEAPAVQYRDFIALEQEALQSEEHKQYWQQVMQDSAFAKLPRRPVDKQSAEPHAGFRAYDLPLGPQLTQQLTEIANRAEVQLKHVLLAAHLKVIATLTGQSDAVTGLVSNGRPEVAGGEQVIGLHLNSLPMRLKLAGGSWLELVQEVFARDSEALPYRRYPMAQIQQDQGGRPLFETLFNYINFHAYDALNGTDRIEVLDQKEFVYTDFVFAAEFSLDQTKGLNLQLQYDSAEFPPEQIAEMSGYYLRALEALAVDPNARYEQQSLLSEQERRRVLIEWNDTRVEYPQDLCLHQLFEAQVERTPDAVAVEFEGESLTYRELNARANRLAHRLQALGAGPDVLIGVCMERSLEMVISLYAVLKSGAAYVPIDPTYPPERLAYVLEDSQVPVLLTQPHLAAQLPALDAAAHVLALHADMAALATESADNPTGPVTATHLAYMIYTSGSTGKPKGAMNTHRAIVNRLLWMQDEYNLTAKDAVLQKTPYSFDVSVWEFFWPLFTGARLVVARPEGHKDSAYLANLIAEKQITTLHFVPSMLQVFLEEPGLTRCTDLRRVICSGEALPHDLQQRFFTRLEQAELHNLYGPTEAAVDVTYWACQRGDDRTTVPIGRPLANTQLYVLDEHLQPVPAGVPGELHIGGIQLARGYHNRPDLTAEKFIPNPFSADPEARLYKTGDLARHLPDGTLEYLGRLDFQVKIRGFRIELGEIEAVLDQHETVAQSVVTAYSDGAGHKRLIAYAVPVQGFELSADDLREHLTQQLPEYMVPAVIMPLDALPLSANGKVDRRALPQPEWTAQKAAYAAPRTATEQALAEIWADVLGVDQVGLDDNYLELGGDSIRSIQVLSRAKDKGLNFTLQDIFQHLTIRTLAPQAASASDAAKEFVPTAPFALIDEADRLKLPESAEDAYPVTSLQAGMLFHSEINPDSSFYHNVISATLRAPFDEQAMRETIAAMLERHPALRTSFDLTSYSRPLQLVHRSVDAPLQVEDIRHLSHDEQERVIEDWFQADIVNHFDWTRAPLVRFHVHRRTDDEFQFAFTEHHAITDGWSIAYLFAEFFQVYLAFAKGQENPLAAPPVVQFRDFVALEQQALQAEEHKQYWQNLLAGSTLLELPHWQPETETEDEAAGKTEASDAKTAEPTGLTNLHTLDVPIPNDVAQGLNQLATLAKAPFKHVLLAAHLKVMTALSGQTDIVTGVVTNGRPEAADAEQVVGLHLNSLPYRFQVEGGTWVELVQQAFAHERETLPHRRYPMAQIQQDQGGRTLFETLFNYVHFHVYDSLEGKMDMEVRDHKDFIYTDLPMTAEFSQNENGTLNLRMQWDGTRHPVDRMEQVASYYLQAMQAMAADPQARYETHSLLSEQERTQQLIEWNGTQADYPQDACLHHLFEAQAARTPDAVAVTCEEQTLTYRELNARANRLASRLAKSGVRRDVPVGLCLERSPEMVVSLLAVLKAGGAYVPVDPSYPADRIAYILQDAAAPVLLTHCALRDKWADSTAEAICLDAEGETLTAVTEEDETNPASDVRPEDLAYLIYTSGSTGRPKGVMIPHRAICNHMLWMQDAYPLTSADRVLQKTPFGFDASVWEFWAPLLAGGQLVMAQPGGHQDSAYLARTVRDKQITVLQLVPTMLHLLLDEPEFAACTSLRRVYCGGEVLTADLQERFFRTLPSASLHNLYGPTETCIDATVWDCRREEQPNRRVPIGRPIANLEAYVLDKSLQPVPVGVPGELHIGGRGLARGYWNRPDLTEKAFIPHPFSEEPGAKLYKTGDLVRYRADGALEYLERIDHQVKLRGFRIELGEIESALLEHADIAQAVVTAQEVAGDMRLIAYLVTESGQAPSHQALRDHLQQHLPEYMVPAVFMELEQLPLLPNGKVDRRALPAPEQIRPEGETVYVAPRTETESKLADIWAQLLGLEKVGIHDSFFDLGGHSLLATRLISHARAAFAVELPLRRLFEADTIAELAGVIEQAQAAKAAQGAEHTEQAVIPSAPAQATYPLSFAQLRMWFLDQLEPGTAAYNIPVAVKLTGTLQPHLLEQSLQTIIDRHAALRTVFTAADGEPAQMILSQAKAHLPVLDLQTAAHEQREQEIRRLADEEAARPFDLAQGPLLRTTLLRLSADEHILLLTMHHIVSDGWSMGLLIQELADLYQSFAEGRPAHVPELSIQYTDFTHWQRGQLQGEALAQQLGYWKQKLASATPVLQLPTDRPRPQVQTWKGAVHDFILPQDLRAKLEALSQQEGATLYMTLLAAFKTLLHRYSGQEDILVGTPVAGRTRSQLEPLIGVFLNTLVLRSDLSGDMSFRTLLQQVRETALGAYEHADVPFEMLVDELQPERNAGASPLFQVLFVLQNTPMPAIETPGLSLDYLDVHSGTAKFDLTLSLTETEQGLHGELEYNTDLYDQATVERMMRHFRTLLEAIVATPEQQLTALPLLTEQESADLLTAWSGEATQQRDTDIRTLHGWFEQQAALTPDATAVVYEEAQLTYDQLNRRANRLAHRLQKVGVGPESRVGLAVERSLEMVIGILGILKAGAAYVPLDPAHPQDRLAFVLEDAEIAALVTQPHLQEGFPAHEAATVLLDADFTAFADESEANPSSGANANNLAYIIYTSGSTGRPKGVQIEHANVVRLMTETEDWYGFHSQDVWTLFHSYAFDFSVWELWGALLYGGRLVIVPHLTARSPEAFYRLLTDQGVTVLNQTPSAFRQLIAAEESLGMSVDLKLRCVIFGGEALELQSLKPWFERHGDQTPQLVNMYGITETTVHVTYRPITMADVTAGTGSVIGRPIPDLSLYLLDQHLRPVPVGVPGEICVGGRGVARGYLNRPDLNAERFIQNPFGGGEAARTAGTADATGERLYRSGDLARYLPNGDLEYLGRIDQQVKIRGFRIELGEIEAVLHNHPAVRDAVVIDREDTPGDKRLVAYWVAASEPAPSVSELSQHLRNSLPEYMVPSAFVALPQIPLTQNGKVDRRALPEPDRIRPDLEKVYVAPNGETEQQLAAIYGRLLNLEQVGANDSFFELGGHSLLATQLMSQVRTVFSVELPLRSLFDAHTVTDLARLIDQQKDTGAVREKPTISRISRETRTRTRR